MSKRSQRRRHSRRCAAARRDPGNRVLWDWANERLSHADMASARNCARHGRATNVAVMKAIVAGLARTAGGESMPHAIDACESLIRIDAYCWRRIQVEFDALALAAPTAPRASFGTIHDPEFEAWKAAGKPSVFYAPGDGYMGRSEASGRSTIRTGNE